MVEAAKLTKKVVVYVGTADVREIDAAAWKNAGVNDQKLVRWERATGFEVPVSDLTADAVRYCDERDDGFVVRDVPA